MRALQALESLILTNNRVTALGDLLVLVSLSELRNLSLIGNPVSKHPKYRMFVINLLPTLAVLDFTKVKEKVDPPAQPPARTCAPDCAAPGSRPRP